MWCLPIYALLCVVIIAVVLFRLFSVAFFWDTISKWAVVPAFVIIALLSIASLRRAARQYAAAALVLCYLASLYFDGWRTIVTRLADGGNVWFEATEMTLIAVFAVLHLMPEARLNDGSNS